MNKLKLSTFLFSIKNYKSALIAALFFGSIAPGTKYLIKNLPPQSMAGILYLFAGIGLFAILLFRKNFVDLFLRIKRKDLKWFLLAIISGGVIAPAFLTYGIANLSGSTSSLLLNLESILTSLIAWFLFKEHFEKKIVYGMIFILLGCIILSFNSFSSENDSFYGIFLISLACLFWGFDNNFTRNISHLDPMLIASMKGLIAGISNIFLGYIIGEKFSWNREIFYTGILGFLGIGISLVSFIISLSKIGTARTGAIFALAPFIGSIIAIIFLHETLSLLTITAFILMLIGLLLHLSEDHGHEHTHEYLNHSHEHIHDEHHQHEQGENSVLNLGPHTHYHEHQKLVHKHPHFPDIHHQHKHNDKTKK